MNILLLLVLKVRTHIGLASEFVWAVSSPAAISGYCKNLRISSSSSSTQAILRPFEQSSHTSRKKTGPLSSDRDHPPRARIILHVTCVIMTSRHSVEKYSSLGKLRSRKMKDRKISERMNNPTHTSFSCLFLHEAKARCPLSDISLVFC